MRSRGLSSVVAMAGVMLACAVASAEPRILLVGDSWARRMFDGGAYPAVLDEAGLGCVEVLGDDTVIGGTTAAYWADAARLALVYDALAAAPAVDIVQLNLGGNDLRSALRPSMSLPAIFAAANAIADDVDTVAAAITQTSPGIRVAWCGYDYPGAGAVSGVSAELVNLAVGLLASLVLERFAERERCFVINNLGLMHYTLGYPGVHEPESVPFPGGYPDYDPLTGGDPQLPVTPSVAADAIHLTAEGYVIVARHCLNAFYLDWLAHPLEGEGEGAALCASEGEGAPGGEGIVEGEGVLEGEGAAEGLIEGGGEGSTEGAIAYQSADTNGSGAIEIGELLRVVQFYNAPGLQCADDTEDGYAPGTGGGHDCPPHDSDYRPQDWRIDLGELLRLIQFYRLGGYTACPGEGEDGYCPAAE
ncbi:MAG: hypothetical protein GC168_10255 [Candidatus Hydrogenedens sp.]|nr:hypothetical protein [Candidatus Hydrogenedens sp.]